MQRHGGQYWTERTAQNRRRSFPSFRGRQSADVVVIGGGLTGCTAAYVLASAGLRVMLLEGGRLASGATAAGLGAILPQPDATFRAVEAAAGLRAARAAWKTARRSALEFASVLRKLDVKCDLTPAALVINARTTGRAAELRREQASRKAAGLDAPWLAGAATTAEIGTESAGALRLREGFTFDPVRAALGLAAAAQASDAQIFERSVVRRTRFTRRYADVVLASGTIRTRQVVVATGTPGALFDQLRRHVREHFGYAVVTESLSARMRRETGRRAGVLTEVADSAPWLRWLPDDRALFAGGRSAPVGWQQLEKAVIRRAADLMYELSVRYPVISGLPARWAWRLPIVSTADGLPWIGPHRNYPFHFFALAFGWHGDGLVWHAARAALRAFHGETTPDDRAFHFVR